MTGRTLKRRRTEAGLTQTALAAKLGVAMNTVSRWELGALPITERMAKLITLTLAANRKTSKGAKS